MLVLSRGEDERIVIGGSVQVVVVDIRKDKVRLGVSAPDDVSVHREEVAMAIEREGKTLGGGFIEPVRRKSDGRLGCGFLFKDGQYVVRWSDAPGLASVVPDSDVEVCRDRSGEKRTGKGG